MLRNAHGTSAPPTGDRARLDLRAHDAVTRTLDELTLLVGAGHEVGRGDVLSALDRAGVRGDAAGAPGRVAVFDLARARTRRFDVVFVLGLEQGTLPRRARVEPFLDEDTRRALDERRGARLVRPDAASRDRYLFATVCSRPRRRLVLVRQAVGDEGSPREAGPFWEAVRELFDEDDVRHQTRRRPLSALTWELEDAPTERERLRALAALAAADPAEAGSLARANGWDRRLERATRAFDRPTRVTHERALRLLARESFSVSELERMASCSAAWFVERYLRPSTIDKQIDRMLRGSILHAALQRFYVRLPSAIPGADRVTEANVEAAVVLMRECVVDAVETGLRIEAGDLDRRELEQSLQRDLEQLVRDEASSASPLVPRHLEVSFRSFELEPGVAVNGKIDRVDGEPMGAQGIVIDYKSGAASSAADIRDRDLLQLPLYMLVLRRQLGLEPVGGIYVPVGGGRRPRGMLRAGNRPGARLQPSRLPRARRLRRGCRGSPADRRRSRGAHPQRGRPARPTGRRLPALVRPVADLQEGPAVTAFPNDQQRAAIEAHGNVFVAAGAGTGKTAVLVERFVRAVVDDGLDVDSLLVITYTERAAGELRARIRAALLERGRADLALELDGAWISTIHGFCRRVLGTYPLAAGVDPSFRVLDEPQALVLQAEAFSAALERFCAADEPERWRLLATYGAVGLRHMLVEVYATLRSAGRELVLESGARAPLQERIETLRDAATGLRDDAGATEQQQAAAAGALELARGDVPSRAPARPRGHEDARAARLRLCRGARRAGRSRARGARRARPRAPARAPDDIRRGVRRGQERGVGGRLRGSAAEGA